MTAHRLLLLTALAICLTAQAREYSVKSPDGSIVFSISLNEAGSPVYAVTAAGKAVIDPSVTGFAATPDAAPAYSSLKKEGGLKKVRAEWKPLWGKRAIVADRYNARTFHLDGSFPATLEVRVYDDGAAFRFTGLPAGEMTEQTSFNFAGDYTAWFYNGERHNIGPEKLSESDGERLPVMTVKAAEDRFLAI
ncbi:MAG: glycoside hydrolase family 97 N-terminal domain-containing protein, partial [Bacteroidales bacterium]|nr:glycoside hydrolase family 97 N-terminal domain-containing protein [Bacteroidales bacterium]